ncbi:MAG TPA: malate/lactate/ureidoglycolate dehydrogenase [Burkholderiaceae bacterium]|nr:malate/lactate/ureidoglycolate dehydrogenase [Burkholderiaceae bacterium]
MTLQIDAAPLTTWVARMFHAAGCTAQEAQTIAASLVQSNLCGHDSHGVGLVPMYLDALRQGEARSGIAPRIVVDQGALLALDGQRGFGQVIGAQAMAIAIERARTFGCAVVGLHNTHHLARIGQWAEQCAAAGYTSVHFVNVLSAPSVAPWGGTDARLVTNPICIGVPHEPHPLVLDYATSAIAVGKAKVALAKGEPVPAGTLIDADGEPTTDPAVLWSERMGALLPFAQHKGYALAIMCELLGGMLSGGRVHDARAEKAAINNMLSIVFAGERLRAPNEQRQQIDALARWVKASPRRDPTVPIQLPGEPERATEAQRRRDGISLPAVTVELLRQEGARLGVTSSPFDD